MGTVRLTLDWRVLAFSGGVAIAATLTFGLVAALRGNADSPADQLRRRRRATAGRAATVSSIGSSSSKRPSPWCCTSGGLLLQTFQHLRNTDLGLQSESC